MRALNGIHAGNNLQSAQDLPQVNYLLSIPVETQKEIFSSSEVKPHVSNPLWREHLISLAWLLTSLIYKSTSTNITQLVYAAALIDSI